MTKKIKKGAEQLSGRELARRLGVSEPAVRKAVKTGRLTPAGVDAKGRNFYDENQARSQWRSNTLPEKSTGEHAVKPKQNVGKTDAASDSKIDVNKARAMREASVAQLTMLKVQEKKGELVKVDDVARLWEMHVADAKKLFLALPIEFRMLIPSLTDDDQTMMTKKIAGVMGVLEKWNPKET